MNEWIILLFRIVFAVSTVITYLAFCGAFSGKKIKWYHWLGCLLLATGLIVLGTAYDGVIRKGG